MPTPEMIAALTPWVRVGLYVLAGYIFAHPEHPGFQLIVTSPEIMAAAVGGLAVLWWRIAKYLDWPT